MGLDQLIQRFPRKIRLHLSQEALALGALFVRRLFVITVGEALRAALTELSSPIKPLHTWAYKPIFAQDGSVFQCLLS